MSSVNAAVNNKLKRPHGESLARAPVEARWQPAEKGPSSHHGGYGDERRHTRPTFSERPHHQRGGPTPRGRGGAGRGGSAHWGTGRGGAAPVAVAVPFSQAAPTVPKPKPKPKPKTKTSKQPAASLQHNSFDSLGDQRTVYNLNDDFNKRRPDRLTHTFAAVHGYKYRKYTTAMKVVKPIELLRVYSSRQAQALEDMLAELALLEAEAQSREKGKEKLDPSDKRYGDDGSENKESDADDAEMQEVMKELVIDLAALNSGKVVQLEPEFDAPTSDFFVAAEHMPRNAGHATKPVFFQAVETNASRGDTQIKVAGQREQANIFWDESAASASGQQPQQQVLSFGPERPDLFFKVSRAKPSSSKPQAKKPTKGMDDEEARELIELERLLQDGFITREQFKERSADLKERIRVRKDMAKQRKAERKREQLEEEKLWEERDRKLMLERREEDKKLKEQKKQALTRAVLDDFLEGRLSPKELAVQIKSGVVTVEQLLGLWKTELRPLRLVDYIQPSGAVQIGPSKHSKIMTDVMYLLQMSDPAKQHGNTIEPSALPQTPEVLHKVEKIAAHNPGLVRKFAHYIHTEREMRAEWQRDVQERLNLACS